MFPSESLKDLSDFVHQRDIPLKLGIKQSSGALGCQGYPGSLNYEHIDGKNFANWGLDYILYSNCYNEGIPLQ